MTGLLMEEFEEHEDIKHLYITDDRANLPQMTEAIYHNQQRKDATDYGRNLSAGRGISLYDRIYKICVLKQEISGKPLRILILGETVSKPK